MGISNVSSNLRPGICTSSTRPSAPYEGQTIYETDTDKVLVWNGSVWYANWNLPWGLVTFGNFTSGSSVTSYFTTTNMPTVTFNAVANRYYKITWYEPEVVANGYNYLELRQTSATGTLLSRAWADVSGEGVAMTIMAGPLTFSTGSVTLVTVLNTSGNGFCTRGASEVARLIVEDVGPA